MKVKERNFNGDKGNIVIYTAKSGKTKLEVKLEKQTVWLTQKQISELFSTERSVITKHLRNIFQTKELIEKSNVQKMHIAFSDKPVKFYNLDVVISIGYRVNSKRATQFRIWATKVLKDYLVEGYERCKTMGGLTINVAAMADANYMNNTFFNVNFINNTVIAFAQGITTLFVPCQRFTLKRM